MNLSLNNHWMRKALQLSLNEMAVLCEIYSLSNNTEYNGWCYKSKQKIGETVDLSKATIIDICNTLELKGYIKKHPETKFLQPTNWIRHIAQEQENFAFMVQSDGFVIASAKMQSIIEGKIGRLESLQSVGNPTESVKKIDQVGKESLPKYNNSNTGSYTEKEIYKEKESGHTYKEYVDYINSKTGKRYRGDSTSSKSFGVRLKKYTFEELKSVVDNAIQDEYHKGNNFMYLTPEFLLRETKIEKFLNSQSKPIGLTEEEKGRLQRLDQYHQFDGKDYMVEKGIWEEYQDLKKRYAVHTNK